MESAAPGPTAPVQTTAVPRYSWYVLGVLVLVYVLNFVDRQIITILAPDIKRDLGLNDADIGFLYGTAFAVFYALFGIPLGRLADSWSRVRLLTIGLGLWSAMTAASGLARGGVSLGLARMGVGVGEATASPSAYSLISDLFPKARRGTALAIYSAGLYVGGGVSLMIGGGVVQAWNHAFPGGGPWGLVGWQAAFMAVGVPGLLLAAWVSTLKEPVRGLVDGLPTPPVARPFAGFVTELLAVIPPFTLLTASRRGLRPLAVNLLGAGVLSAAAVLMITATGGSLDRFKGSTLQWTCIAFGYYAIFSWATSIRQRDRPTFTLIWGSPAFLATILGYGCVSFLSYASTAFAPAFAQDVLGVSAARTGYWVGGFGALGGFFGVTLGGRLSDVLLRRNPAGRILVVAFGLLAPAVPVWLAFSTVSVPGDGDFYRFVALASLANMLASSALGAAGATTQDLVLPRMRGTATATFFLATTLVGLALGPYLAGFVSATTGSLATGVKSVLLIIPVGVAALAVAYRLVPAAAATALERARAAGEAV